MKNKLLVGMAVASFSLTAFAQDTKVIGNVTIQYPGSQRTNYSPQPGVTIEFANRNLGNSTNQTNNVAKTSNTMPTTPSMGAGNGIDNGAPDLSEYQAQSMATAQALNNQPVDLQNAPEGAESILKNGSQALGAGNTQQLNSISKEFEGRQNLTVGNNKGVVGQSNQVGNPTLVKNEEPKPEMIVTDISSWNQSTIKQFEKEGKERTEQRYKEFLSK